MMQKRKKIKKPEIKDGEPVEHVTQQQEEQVQKDGKEKVKFSK